MTIHHFGWNKPLPPSADGDEQPIMFMVGYYQRAFALLHDELEREGYKSDVPHPIRRRFWRLLRYREYDPIEGRELVLKYIDSVEHEIAGTVSKHSLAYWLHLYRRLSPGPIGLDRQPVTIGEVRAALEAAIQKYGKFEPCDGVGITGDIPVECVLGGILMNPEFDIERQGLETIGQLVLTDFTTTELREFYDIERLAYEIWRSSALLRIMAKGASLVVDDSEICVFDVRSDELDRLVGTFDNRNNRWNYWLLSSTGVVSDIDTLDTEDPGIVFLPGYNISGVPIDEFDFFFERFNVAFKSFGFPMVSNFFWLPLSLRQYREAHLLFANAFAQKYGVELDAVLLVISALCIRVLYMWTKTEGSLIRLWQRAYEGPYTRDYILDEIQDFAPIAAQRLGLDQEHARQTDLPKAVRFWELDKSKRLGMDLAYSGPHHVFLPYGKNRMFIDYAWIIRRLYSLFVDVSIPDQNFKGDALESLVRSKKSVLPVHGCKSLNGDKRQIDAAFEVGDRLIIIECRAVGKSIGFSRGNPDAIRYRNQLVNKALEDIDEKARWLANHPAGTNYDVTHCNDILPIAVTPFAEYIPSLHQHYWLTDDLPRVLTPEELIGALENGTLANIRANTVPIRDTA